MTNAIAIPEKNDKALTAVDQARALIIKTNEDFAAADQFSMSLKGLEKEVDAAYDEHISAAFSAHKSLVAKKKLYAAPIEEARKIIRSKMGVYQDEQEAIRVKEEARLREIARKEAEEAALNAAIEAESSGDTEGASAIMAEPVVVAPVVLSKSVPKASTSIPRPWTFRVVNLALVPRAYLMLDEVKLGQQARATKDTIKIPGIEFFQRPA